VTVIVEWLTSSEVDMEDPLRGGQGIMCGMIAVDEDFVEIDRTSFMVRYSMDHDWSDAYERKHGVTRSRLVNEGFGWSDACELFHDFTDRHCRGLVSVTAMWPDESLALCRQLLLRGAQAGWKGNPPELVQDLSCGTVAHLLDMTPGSLLDYVSGPKRRDAQEIAEGVARIFRLVNRELKPVRAAIASARLSSTSIIDSSPADF
jgi:hypothetical protein